MDYHSIHGNDVASFDISSSHRLPTVSASTALEELESDRNAYMSCGLEGVDRVIAGSAANEESSSVRGGVRRGQVTELWGPPGTGKTAFALQAAANAVCDGHGVVWVDCFQACPSQRIATVLQAVRKARGQDIIDDPRGDEKFAPFTHYGCLTLPHLIALVSRPTTRSVPSNVGLVVVSSVTALINSALPRPQDGKQGLNSNRAPNPSVRRRRALQSIMKALQTLASTRNCAVVVLSQCATRMQSGRSATLTPAVNANVWEQGVSTRLVLFRDWIWQNTKSAGVFLIGLQKLDGKDTPGTFEHVSAFKVNADGIVAVPHDEGHRRSADRPDVTQSKRKLAQTDFEIPDSEDDEDYGWANEDEAYLPPLPQQWQGSEDILLGHDVGRSDEDNDVQDDGDRSSDEPDA